jgi:hypothetical protein
MKLRVYWIDLRGGYTSKVSFRSEIIDDHTGKEVGFVDASRSPRQRHISLFGGKYQGDFESPEECTAFAKGIEAVLNHAVEIPETAATQVA